MSKALKKYVEVTDVNKEGKALYFLATSINYVDFIYTWEEEMFHHPYMDTVESFISNSTL